MIDTLNFKKQSHYVILEKGVAVVHLPLTVKRFRDVYDDYADKSLALKALSYVACMAHYGSPGNVIGLPKRELREDALIGLDLPSEFEETQKIKLAIKYYEEHYNKGVFGLFKEMANSFEITRESISIINFTLSKAVKELKILAHEDGQNSDVVLSKLDTVMGAIAKIRTLAGALSTDVNKLKEIEGILISEEESNLQLYGGGSVPLSSVPSNSIK